MVSNVLLAPERAFISGFARFRRTLLLAALEPHSVRSQPATISTAVAASIHSMQRVPPAVHPLALSIELFEMNMNLEQQSTPPSSTSSSSSEPSRPTAATTPKKLKKRAGVKALPTKRLSNEEKQAKNRLFVKRCYYKKREALKNLREEVAQLETKFSAVMEGWQRHNQTAADDFRLGRRRITPQDLYAELTMVRGALLEEQQRLNLRLADRHLFRQRLQQLYEPTR